MSEPYPQGYPSSVPATPSGRYPSAYPGAPPRSYPGPDGRPADAVRVWAYHLGIWRPGNGYDHAVPVSSFDHLVTSLTSLGLTGKVSRLVILAHGDAGGRFVLPPSSVGEPAALTTATLPHYSTQLTGLAALLVPKGGELVLMSCITGRGAAGAALLAQLSGRLTGTRVIGFTTVIWFSLHGSTAGQVKDTGETSRLLVRGKEAAYRGHPDLDIASPHAKVAFGGAVTSRRIPGDDAVVTAAPAAEPAWLNKKLWQLRCDPGAYMSLKRSLEKQGRYYYESPEDTEGCTKAAGSGP